MRYGRRRGAVVHRDFLFMDVMDSEKSETSGKSQREKKEKK